MLIQSDDDKRTGNFVNGIWYADEIDSFFAVDLAESGGLSFIENVVFIDTDVGISDGDFQSFTGTEWFGIERTHAPDIDTVFAEFSGEVCRMQIVVS